MTDLLAFFTVILISIVVGMCITNILVVSYDDYDDDISGREESRRPINEPYHQPYTYYLGTNKNKTYKKQKRSRWKEVWDFN